MLLVAERHKYDETNKWFSVFENITKQSLNICWQGHGYNFLQSPGVFITV